MTLRDPKGQTSIPLEPNMSKTAGERETQLRSTTNRKFPHGNEMVT